MPRLKALLLFCCTLAFLILRAAALPTTSLEYHTVTDIIASGECEWRGSAPFCSRKSCGGEHAHEIFLTNHGLGAGKDCWFTGKKTLCCKTSSLTHCTTEETYGKNMDVIIAPNTEHDALTYNATVIGCNGGDETLVARDFGLEYLNGQKADVIFKSRPVGKVRVTYNVRNLCCKHS